MRGMRTAAVLVACVAVATVVVVVSSGDDSDSLSISAKSAAVQSGPTHAERQGLRSRRQDVDGKTTASACADAAVSLGPDRGAIDFSIACDPAGAGGDTRVVVARYHFDQRPAPSDIAAVQAGPRGPRGGGRSLEECRLKGGNVLCTFPASEAVKVRGRFWVEPGERCALGVAAYEVEASECPSGACRLSLEVNYLWRGSPQGCR